MLRICWLVLLHVQLQVHGLSDVPRIALIWSL